MLFESSIGILIRYYRKINKMTVDELIIDKSTDTLICSKKTFSTIEKGLVRKIDTLDLLCKRINKLFIIDPQLINQLNIISNELTEALCEMSIEKMKKIYSKLNNFKLTDQYIYYYEYSSLYKDIINYFAFNNIPDLNNIDIYLELLKINHQPSKKLILYFLYNLSNINTKNIDRKNIIQQCDAFLEDPLFFYRKTTHIFENHSLIDSYLIYSEMLKDKKLNTYQIAHLNYMLGLCLINVNQYNEAYFRLIEALNYALDNQFPVSVELKFYNSLAICAYGNEKYSDAVHHFEKVFELNKMKINYNYIFYMYSLEQLQEYEKIQEICNSMNSYNFQNKLVENIFLYYRIKHDNTKNNLKFKILEKILSDDLIKLVRFGDGYKKIITEELSFVCSITKNYKLLQLVL